MKTTGKRVASTSQGPSKRRKIHTALKTSNKPGKLSAKGKGTEKASDRKTIPIPIVPRDDEDEDSALSDQDLELLEEYGDAASFLNRLDQTGISR